VKRRIMIVDDHEVNRELLGHILKSRGYEVAVAIDGHDAISQLEEGLPDLMFLDLQMPRLDGYGTIERIRATPAFASLPVIALTAWAMPTDKERCLAAGFCDHLSKPFGLKDLDALLNRHLR
jgi:CheY-like chemotaxis protein